MLKYPLGMQILRTWIRGRFDDIKSTVETGNQRMTRQQCGEMLKRERNDLLHVFKRWGPRREHDGINSTKRHQNWKATESASEVVADKSMRNKSLQSLWGDNSQVENDQCREESTELINRTEINCSSSFSGAQPTDDRRKSGKSVPCIEAINVPDKCVKPEHPNIRCKFRSNCIAPGVKSVLPKQ